MRDMKHEYEYLKRPSEERSYMPFAAVVGSHVAVGKRQRLLESASLQGFAKIRLSQPNCCPPATVKTGVSTKPRLSTHYVWFLPKDAIT